MENEKPEVSQAEDEMDLEDRLLKKASDLGWSVTVSDDHHCWEFRKYSPAGEDFLFEVTGRNIVANVKDYYETFAPEEHVMVLVEAKRNGFCGVPAIRTLCDDADAIDEMLHQLADAFADVESAYQDTALPPIERTLALPKDDVEYFRRLMQAKSVDYGKHKIAKFSTVESWTVQFPNGYEVDLKVCSSDCGAPLWCEAVLFLDGCECYPSDVEDELLGEWSFEDEGKSFLLKVVEESEGNQ